MTVSLALIENAMEAAEMEVRPSDNMKMKNFETSSWKPVQWKCSTLSIYMMYMYIIHLYMPMQKLLNQQLYSYSSCKVEYCTSLAPPN